MNKYMSLAVIATLGTLMFSSCDDSKNNDFVQEYEGAPGVYFSTTENSYLELSENQSTISYPVYRDVAGDELTVEVFVTPLDDDDDDEIFTFPQYVTFAAGSKVADFVIGYDFSKTAIGDEHMFELELDAQPTPFATNVINITLVNPAPWEELGMGDYYDYYWGVTDESYGPVKVKVYQQGIDKNLYRVSNPYLAFNDDENSYFQFRVLQEGDVFFGVTIDRPDLVGYDMYYVGYEPYFSSDMYIAFPGYFQGLDSTAAWKDSYVVEYRDDGLPGLIQLVPLYYAIATGSGYGYDRTKPIEIYFPDFELLDTSLSVNYEGVLTGTDQKESVLLYTEIGADVTEGRAAIAYGTDGNALIESIIDGTADFVTFSQSGNVKIPIPANSQSGNYVAAVVVYNNGTVKNSESVRFLYVSKSADDDFDPNKGWTSLGYTPYTDAFVCARTFLSDYPPYTVTYPVELQQNDANPGIYRLVNAYGEGSAWSDTEYNPYTATYIVINATDPSRVYLELTDQYFVIEYMDGGADTLLNIWSLADYYLKTYPNEITPDDVYEEGLYGTMDNGVITFPALSLLAYWEYSEDEDDTGLFQANYALDLQLYQASYGQQYMWYNDEGEIIAPFYVDVNDLYSADEIKSRSVSLAPRSMSLPKSAYMLSRPTINRHLFDKKKDVKSQRQSQKPLESLLFNRKRK